MRLPPFHFSFEANLRNALEKMGVHRIFDDQHTLLAMAPQMSGVILRGVAQRPKSQSMKTESALTQELFFTAYMEELWGYRVHST